MGTLAEADRIRGDEQAKALAIYADCQDEIQATDAERILWICEQVAPTPPPALDRLLARAMETGTPLVRRGALHARATIAWFEGRAADAERLWSAGLSEPTDERDRFWIRSCLNLATVMMARECEFEALVLTGMGLRAAQAAELPYLSAFASIRRADLLIKMGDLQRAEAELLEGASHLGHVARAAERRVVEYEYLTAQSTLRESEGRLPEALRLRDRQREVLETYGHVEDAILYAVELEQLRLQFEIAPERRPDLLAAIEGLPDRYEMGPAHRTDWQRVRSALATRHALADGDIERAREHARASLELLTSEVPDSERVIPAADLGQLFASELDAPDDARRAFDLAASACLRRIVEAHKASHDIPELADATREDWDALATYRERLALSQKDLLQSVASVLKPGAPAFELLMESEAIRVCAWCQRVRTTDGEWLPIAHYIPSTRELMVSHGICESCLANVFAE